MDHFPGSAVVKNPPANAGDTGLSPGPGRSYMPRSNQAHAPQLLSLSSTAHEPQLRSPRATTAETHKKRSHCNEKPTDHKEEYPPLAASRESLRTATKTQCSNK